MFNYKTAFLLYALLIFFIFKCKADDDIIELKGKYNGFQGDSIEIVYWRYLPNSASMSLVYNRDVAAINKENEFHVKIKSDSLVYFELNHLLKDGARKVILKNFLGEPGDEIYLSIENDLTNFRVGSSFAYFDQKIVFSGKGSDKYSLLHLLERKSEQNLKSEEEPELFQGSDYSREMNRIGRFYQRMQTYTKGLDSLISIYSDQVNQNVLDVLYLDIKAKKMNLFYRPLSFMVNELINVNKTELEKFKSFYIENFELDTSAYDKKMIPFSVHYPSFVLNKISFESSFFNNGDVLERIDKEFSGSLRERLLIEYIVRDFSKVVNKLDGLGFSFQNVLYQELFDQLKNRQFAGAVLPDFQLQNTNGELVSLSEFKNKVIFIDFWYTGCAGCLAYYRDIVSVVEEQFNDIDGVVFVTISIDISKEKWLKSIEEGRYSSSSSVNLFTNGLGAKHAIIKSLGIESYPRPIIIGKDGRVFSNNYDELRTSPKNLSKTIMRALDAQ